VEEPVPVLMLEEREMPHPGMVPRPGFDPVPSARLLARSRP
jgi:hypothetical protein